MSVDEDSREVVVTGQEVKVKRRKDKWCGETRSAESIYIDRSVPLNKDPTRRTAAEDRKRRRGATKGGESRSSRRRAKKGTNQSQLDLSVTMQKRERTKGYIRTHTTSGISNFQRGGNVAYSGGAPKLQVLQIPF